MQPICKGPRHSWPDYLSCNSKWWQYLALSRWCLLHRLSRIFVGCHRFHFQLSPVISHVSKLIAILTGQLCNLVRTTVLLVSLPTSTKILYQSTGTLFADQILIASVNHFICKWLLFINWSTNMVSNKIYKLKLSRLY